MNQFVLRAEDLTKSYGAKSLFDAQSEGKRVLDHLSLSVSSGEIVGLVGESGSGKSTLCRHLLLLERPDAGTVLWNDEKMPTAPARTMRSFRRHVQAIFQDPLASLHPRKSVFTALEEPLRIHAPQLRQEERRSKIEQALKTVNLDPWIADRKPQALSGGQQQRVSIARALILEPVLLIADEPITALDVSVQAQIVNLLLELRRTRGIGCLFVSHDLNMVRFACDRVAVMHCGRIVEQNATSELFTHPSHPYTLQLLRATPYPDPDHPFVRDRITGLREEAAL
jgi:ABC-type oligopeptide transport system ATPase subunit